MYIYIPLYRVLCASYVMDKENPFNAAREKRKCCPREKKKSPRGCGYGWDGYGEAVKERG